MSIIYVNQQLPDTQLQCLSLRGTNTDKPYATSRMFYRFLYRYLLKEEGGSNPNQKALAILVLLNKIYDDDSLHCVDDVLSTDFKTVLISCIPTKTDWKKARFDFTLENQTLVYDNVKEQETVYILKYPYITKGWLNCFLKEDKTGATCLHHLQHLKILIEKEQGDKDKYVTYLVYNSLDQFFVTEEVRTLFDEFAKSC
jgi:hypothetical protein